MTCSRPGRETAGALLTGAVLLLMGVALGEPRAHAAEPEHWAQKLGYGDAKVFILHADDGGMFVGANTAIQDLLATGAIQSASLMTPPAFYPQFVEWHNLQASTFDVGIHLTLNSEWGFYRWGPEFAPPKSVKRILEHTFFCWGWKPILPNKIFKNWLCRAPRTVRKEIGRQVEVAVSGDSVNFPPVPKMDPPPSHLDIHMGAVFVRKSHFKKYLEVALDTGIPALTFSNFEETLSCLSGVPQGEPAMQLLEFVSLRMMSLRRAQREFEEEHGWPFPRLDRYCVIPYGPDLPATRQKLETLIQNLPNGITQFLFHPSDEDPLVRAAMGNDLANRRIEIDREIFRILDPTAPGYVADEDMQLFMQNEGIVFTNWLKMMRRFEDPCTDPMDGEPYVQPAGCTP